MRLYFFPCRTDRGAPNYCLVSVDLESPHYTNWTTLIGEHDRNVLEWAACVGKDRIVTCYMVDVKNALKVRLKLRQLIQEGKYRSRGGRSRYILGSIYILGG